VDEFWGKNAGNTPPTPAAKLVWGIGWGKRETDVAKGPRFERQSRKATSVGKKFFPVDKKMFREVWFLAFAGR
jgi:hypothetical protein